MKRMLIDTNIYSMALKGDQHVVNTLRKHAEIGFSVVSVGELLSGFKGGSKESENKYELEDFLDSPRVVVYPADDETAEFYAEVLHRLRTAGTPIPTNDIWIAATAFQNGLRLFSTDIHFEWVKGLSLIKQ